MITTATVTAIRTDDRCHRPSSGGTPGRWPVHGLGGATPASGRMIRRPMSPELRDTMYFMRARRRGVRQALRAHPAAPCRHHQPERGELMRQEIIDLYDEYTHERLDRRVF